MLVYLPPHQGWTCTGNPLAPGSGPPLLSVPGADTSTDGSLVSPAPKTVSYASSACAASFLIAGKHRHIPSIHTVTADGVLSAAVTSVSDVGSSVASEVQLHSNSAGEDGISRFPADNLREKQQKPPLSNAFSVSKTLSPSSSCPVLLFLPIPKSVPSLHTGTSHSSTTTSLPATFVLQVSSETTAFSVPSEFEKQLQIALTAAGVHVSPYTLRSVRRHILRSKLASLRYFMPPAMPPVLVSSIASSPCFCLKREEAGGGDIDIHCRMREQRFCVAPDIVVHLAFQSWKYQLFFPMDAGAAAVMGFIPSSLSDTAAAAALAAWGCVAVKRRRMSSLRQALATRRHKPYVQPTGTALRSGAEAAVAKSSFEQNQGQDFHDRAQLPVDADASLFANTAPALPRENHSAVGVVTSRGIPAVRRCRPLPLSSLCPREAALRALAYWSCLAELQELELQQDQRLSVGPSPACGTSSIRLLQQIKQSFDSVMKTVLKRQQDALDQLRERQSCEMEEASDRREVSCISPAAIVSGDDSSQAQSPMCKLTPLPVAASGSPVFPTDVAATPAQRHVVQCVGAVAALPPAANAELAASATASAFSASCVSASALREGLLADEESSSSTRGETSPQPSVQCSAETSLLLPKNRYGVATAQEYDAAMRELSNVTSQGLGETGLGIDVVSSNVEAIRSHAQPHNPIELPLTSADKAYTSSRRSAEDTKSSSYRHDKDATGRDKVEALVLQHVSEFQLVEMHWQAESLLLRRQQLEDLKNIAVDLVILRRASRQGHLASPLVLPSLPSASEGDIMQLSPKITQSASFQVSSPGVGMTGKHKRASLPCAASEEQEHGKNNVPPGLRTPFDNLQRKPVSGERNNCGKEKEDVAMLSPQLSSSGASQVQKPVTNTTVASPDEAEVQEIQDLLRIYLPARQDQNEERGVGSVESEKTVSRKQNQTQASSRSGMGGRTPSTGAAPLFSAVLGRRKSHFAHGVDLQRRPLTFNESEREISSVQPKMWHSHLSSPLREPLPAALQLVTPTKLLRGIMQYQQQRRRTADDARQLPLQASVPQRGESTQARGLSELSYPPEGGDEGRQLPRGAFPGFKRNGISPFFHRNTCTVSETSVLTKKTETTRPSKFVDMTELEAWEKTVKMWTEEHGVEQLQQHAFLPLMFGKQRKRSVVVRICSGNIADVVACDPENSGTCPNKFCDSGFQASCNNIRTDAPRTNPRKTFNKDPSFPTGNRAVEAYQPQWKTWGDYDYCSELAATPPPCSDDTLFSKLVSFESECCSVTTALTGFPTTSGSQLNKHNATYSANKETLAHTGGASGATTHGIEKYDSLSSADVDTLISESVDGNTRTRTCRPQRPSRAADRTPIVPAAASVGRSRREESPFPILGPSGADPEFGTLGVVLPVGSSLKLTAPTHLRWESYVSSTTDFVFPPLDEQRQMLYRTLLQDQHYRQLLQARMLGKHDAWEEVVNVCEETAGEATRMRSCRNYGSSYVADSSGHSVPPASRYASSHPLPRLHLGDVFISRHSNSRPFDAVFHLVVHEDKDPVESGIVHGGQPASRSGPVKVRYAKEDIPLCVLQGVGEVLRICNTEGMRTLVVPLLLVEGEAAICSLPYASLQQRALQVVRYVINEIKLISQNSSDIPNLRQIVLVLPPMPMNTASARRLPLKRASSNRGTADIGRCSTSATVIEKVEQNADTFSRDSPGSVRSVDGGIVEDGCTQGRSGCCDQHPTTALKKYPLSVDSWLEGVLNLVISYVRNCGHCWVGKPKSRPLHRLSYM